MTRKPQMFDKYDRPTIHHYLAKRKAAAEELVQAAIEDYNAEQPKPEPLDFDGMPLNWEAREYEKMLDFKAFMAGE